MTPSHIAYEPGTLRLLDQTLLPAREQYLDIREWPPVVEAIRNLRVRGAPAIGIVAAYGMALAAHESQRRGLDGDALFTELERAAKNLIEARPTAVNLAWAVNQALEEIRGLRARAASANDIADRLDALAAKIHEDDIESCRRIGDAGAQVLPHKFAALTHCNTGDLATGGYGTALGVIRSAHRLGKLTHVYVDETRPMLQGARLTTWELARDGIPFTLITDNMAAHFMQRAKIGAVIVGADRIAANGDAVNKIGTYGLAVLARAHGVPFMVAAPLSSFDPNRADGSTIVIEERSPNEVTSIGGVPMADKKTQAANPAFDMTPAEYISFIVTEAGALQAPYAPAIARALHKAKNLAGTRGS